MRHGVEFEQAKCFAFLTAHLPEKVVEDSASSNAAHYEGWRRENRLVLTDVKIENNKPSISPPKR